MPAERLRRGVHPANLQGWDNAKRPSGEVRAGERSTALQGGVGRVLPAQLYLSPLISVPRDDSLQGDWGKQSSIWVPGMEQAPALLHFQASPLLPWLRHTCTRKHKGFGCDQLQ